MDDTPELLKAFFAIDVTELGIMKVSRRQVMKAASPIDVIELGIKVLLQPATNSFDAVFIIALQMV